MGTQWLGMGKDTLEKCDIELCKLILSPSSNDLDKLLNIFVMNVAIQIALIDCLQNLGIEPDGIVGHSIGELGMSTESS
jgi:fatty acid synthase, animal type